MHTNRPIENIIFDFGGVLLDIDYQRTYDALSTLLKVNFDVVNLPSATQNALADFETGKINVETFIWNLQRLATEDVPIGQDIIKAWNAMLIGWNPAKFEFLLSLRKRYNVYLLSNTNELHLEWVYKDLKHNHGIIDFDQTFFNKTYYSHLLGFKKPDKEIFEWVTQDLQLDISQTIFIDDLAHNIIGAAAIGWQTYQHNPKEDLIDIFRNRLKLL
ncbi:MAG: HAD family phosphatase [Saprospiraceae bacterium]|nr:HAD family phosphatase [Saprospiraceae bacterium]